MSITSSSPNSYRLSWSPSCRLLTSKSTDLPVPLGPEIEASAVELLLAMTLVLLLAIVPARMLPVVADCAPNETFLSGLNIGSDSERICSSSLGNQSESWPKSSWTFGELIRLLLAVPLPLLVLALGAPPFCLLIWGGGCASDDCEALT